MTNIVNISGIGPAAAGLLKANGFKTAEDIAAADIEALLAVKGFGPARAKNILDAAKALLASAGEDTPPADKPKTDSGKKKKKKDKKKKAKKKDKMKNGKKKK